MKKSIIIVVFTVFVADVFAQTKPDFNKEVMTFFSAYENCMSTIGDKSKTPEQLKTAKKPLRDLIESPALLVPNDLNKEANDTLLKLSQYLTLLEERYPQGYEMKLNLAKIEFQDLHIDQARNTYRVKATVTKKFTEPLIAVSDPLPPIGDTLAQLRASYDTTFMKKITNLTFYFTTSIEFGKYTPLKLEAVQVAGKQPEFYKPLGELTAWWIKLEPTWKKKLSEELKLPEVPSEYFLQRIHGVEKIDLSGIKVTNWEVLEQLKGVRELDLSGLGLDTLIMLQNLTKLKILNVSNNKLRSLHGLENCTNLEVLNVSQNQVTDISPIAGCTTLMALIFNENQVQDISPVKQLAHLRTLQFSTNKVTDISVLKHLRVIKNLDISKNKEIDNISFISHLVMMEKLDIYNTKAGTLEPLRGMVNLIHLDAGYAQIHSLDPIKNHQLLGHLNIAGNPIDDFSALNNLKQIRKLYVGSVKISDISPIMNMENIRVLNATHTNFSKEDIQRFKKKYPNCEITYY